jgi:hypothetical protein
MLVSFAASAALGCSDAATPTGFFFGDGGIDGPPGAGGWGAFAGSGATAGAAAAGAFGGAGGSGALGGSGAVAGAGAGGAPPATTPLATGVAIAGITLYQAVSVPIVADGADIAQRNAPVVAGRDALVRILVAPAAGWQPRQLAARLELVTGGAPTVIEAQAFVAGPSSEGDLASSINVEAPGGLIAPDTSYSVELHETAPAAPPGDASGARWPAQGASALGAESTNGGFHLEIVPYRYLADGSGRLPDTGESTLEELRRMVFSLYPVPNVEISVHAPIDTYTAIPQGGGAGPVMSNLLTELCTLRQKEPHDPKTYWYGWIAPSPSAAQQCPNGCVWGIGALGQSVPDDMTRCGVGLGYPGEKVARVLAHEMAHTLGRLHSPCGSPAYVDPAFPYAGGGIGTWGYDLTTKTLKDPYSHTDLLAYCEPYWISDYMYDGIFRWLQQVNAMARIAPGPGAGREWHVGTVQQSGAIEWYDWIHLRGEPKGEWRTIQVRAGDGSPLGSVDGAFYPFDHLPGGMILVPRPHLPAPRGVRATLEQPWGSSH